MKALIKITYYELKILIRSKINFILLPILLYYLYFSIWDGITNLTLSGYVVQILILGSMIISYQSINQEHLKGYIEVFRTIGYRDIQLLAKLLANYIYISIINIFILGIVIIFGVIQNQPDWILLEAIQYVFLYYYMSSLISVTIGGSIASLIRGKLGFAVLLVIGICIGPLGKSVCEIIFTMLGLELNNLINTINIGQYHIYEGFNFLYGYEIESTRFIHRIIYLLFSFIMIISIWSYKEKKLLHKFLGFCCIILVIPLLYVYNTPSYIYKAGIIGDDAKSVHDYNYYQSQEATDFTSKFEFTKMVLEVDTNKILNVQGEFFIKIKEDTQEINMTLYRDLKIDTIRYNNENIDFNQINDNITIYFPEIIRKETEISLAISYRGISSNYFYAGEKGTILASYYNWLPYPGKTTTMYIEKSLLKTMPLYSTNEVFYDIKYKGKRAISSNLSISDNHIKGLSKEGVNLISGYLYYLKQGNIQYYYTKNIPEKEMISYTDKLNTMINIIEHELGIKNTHIKNIYFIPIKDEFITTLDTNILVNSMKTGETVITNAYPDMDHLTEEYFLYEALSCIFNSNIEYVTLDTKIKQNIFSSFIERIVSNNEVKVEGKFKKAINSKEWITKACEIFRNDK